MNQTAIHSMLLLMAVHTVFFMIQADTKQMGKSVVF